MPDVMDLPGIDPAPSAPQDPATDTSAAPASLPEDTSAQSASALETGEPQSPEGDPAQHEEPRSREDRGVSRRIGEVLERERIANQRAERMESLVEKVLSGVISPAQARDQTPPEEKPPVETDFADWREFNKAEIAYQVRQGVRSHLMALTGEQNRRNEYVQQVQRAQATEQAKQQLHGVVTAQLAEASKHIPELATEVANAHYEIPTNVEAAMALSGAAGHVALYFARHPQVMAQLSRLPDIALGTQIAKIATAMRSGSYTNSNAPAPGNPSAGNRGSTPMGYPPNATAEQHIAWRNRMAKAASARK